jgi:hypothetical protein
MKNVKRLLCFVLVMIISVSLFSVVSASTAAVTWDPNNKGNTVTLSNNNLTATILGSDTSSNIFANVSNSTGKWYWEVKCDSTNGALPMVGIICDTFDPNSTCYWLSTKGYGYYGANGNIYTGSNGYGSTYGASYTVGDVIGVALDLDNRTIAFYKNGVSQGVAVSSLPSGTIYPALSCGSYSSSTSITATAHFAASDFVYTAPTGFLPLVNNINVEAPTNLSAIAGNAQVSLSWTSVTDATSYNIMRATTAGGTYITVASGITTTSYTDITVSNGTTYYYIVTAVNTDTESENSNEASATPSSTSSIQGNRAILVITMTSGAIKEYDLSAAEIDAFLAWYDNKENGIEGTKGYFTFNKSYNVKPFLNRKEYIAFSKIQDFEIKDYNDVN